MEHKHPAHMQALGSQDTPGRMFVVPSAQLGTGKATVPPAAFLVP